MRAWQYRISLTLCLLLAATGTSWAEGAGVAVSDRLVLHPGVAVETRYDSNVFFQSQGHEMWAFLLRVMPTLDVATRPAQRGGATPHLVDFRLHAGVDYREYLSTNQEIRNHRGVGVDSSALLTLFPFGTYVFDIYDNYVRTTQPPYSVTSANLNRDTNELGARFRYRPGGQRLEFDLSYTFGLDLFENNAYNLQDFNVQYHRVAARGSWKFLPKTAMYIEVSEMPYLYFKKGVFRHPNSYPLRAITGVTGLITTKLTLNGWIGYGNGFYVRDPLDGPYASPSTPIGGVDANWRASVLANGGLGYKHDFVNSLLGSYYDIDQVYARWAQLLWHFTATARLQYQHMVFHAIPLTAGLDTTTRTDNYIALDLRLDYPIKDWLTASCGYDLQWNTSNAALTTPLPGSVGVTPVDYTKQEGWLRLAVLY